MPNKHQFVEHHDDFTNQVIGDWLDVSGQEKDYGSFECADEKHRNLWRGDEDMIRALQSSKHPVNFTVWIQIGDGPIHKPRDVTTKPKVMLRPASSLPKPPARTPVNARPKAVHAKK